MQTVGEKWLRTAFLGAAVLIFLAALIGPEWIRGAIRRDRAEAIPQQGVATVAILVPPQVDATGTTSPALVSVRFRGQIVAAKTVADLADLEVGKSAQIVYRIGKSGRIYVDRVAPLSSSSASPAKSAGAP